MGWVSRQSGALLGRSSNIPPPDINPCSVAGSQTCVCLGRHRQTALPSACPRCTPARRPAGSPSVAGTCQRPIVIFHPLPRRQCCVLFFFFFNNTELAIWRSSYEVPPVHIFCLFLSSCLLKNIVLSILDRPHLLDVFVANIFCYSLACLFSFLMRVF